MLDVLAQALELARAGQPVCLVTLVQVDRSTPRDAGARMLVRGDGSIAGTIGGGAMEGLAIDEALSALQVGEPRLVDLSLSELEMQCGGRVTAFVEPLVAPPRLLLFGGGHVGREVSRVAALVGLAVHVVDDRAEWASAERFPEATRCLAVPFAAGIDELGTRSTDRVVIVTRGHDHDQAVLEALVGRDLAYLGMIGSKRKVAVALKALRECGVPADAIARIRAPIGLDLGGGSPAEIAVAVVAEMIAVAHGRDGSVAPMKRT